MMLRTKILCLFLAWQFAAFNYGKEQETSAQSQPVGVRCVISVSKQTVLPYESIGVLVQLRNETTEVKRVIASWRASLGIDEITVEGVKRFGYTPDHEPIALPPVASPIELGPGESKTWIAHLDYQHPGRHVFERPGRYEIVGRLGYKTVGREGDYFDSEPIKITVLDPKGSDHQAYLFLQTSEVHKYFSEHTVWKYHYNAETAQAVEGFIARFQKSRYATLARLGLAMMWIQGVDGKKDIEKGASLLQQVAQSEDKTLGARAYYYLVKLAQEQSNLVDTQKYNRQTLSFKKMDPYFEYLAKYAQDVIQERLFRTKR